MTTFCNSTWRLLCQVGWWYTILVSFCGLTGCGYTLLGDPAGAEGTSIPLAVEVFTNHTYEPGLETRLTAALRQAVLQSHPFRLASPDVASHRVQGIVREVRTIALSFDANDAVSQYRIEADIHIRLLTKESSKALLEQDITARSEYLVSQNAIVRIVREEVVAREAALARLAAQFASQCTTLLTVFLL